MAGRKVFEDSVVPLPEEDGPIQRGMLVQSASASDQTDTMDVLFALGLDEKATADLEDKVAAGEVVSPEELAAVTVPEIPEKLTDWLASHGFEVAHISDDGSSVYAKSTVANIAKQLQVDMAQVTQDGITYNAARKAPSLPARRRRRRPGDHRAAAVPPRQQAQSAGSPPVPADPEVASAVTLRSPPYLVAEILAAYGAGGLTVTGAGQTIAILIDTVPETSDIAAFWKANDLTTKASRVKGSTWAAAVLPPAEGEETLDVEWSSGIAPRCQDPGLRQRIAVVRRTSTARSTGSSPTSRGTRAYGNCPSASASVRPSSAVPRVRSPSSTRSSCGSPRPASTCSCRAVTRVRTPIRPVTAPTVRYRPSTSPRTRRSSVSAEPHCI